MSPDQERAALLTAWAQELSPASLGPVFATVGDWAAASGAQLREGLHTLAAEAVCDAGEYVMKRKARRLRRRKEATA